MILVEARKIIVASAFDPDQRDAGRVKPLEPLAVPDRDEPVPGAMKDIGMAFYLAYPQIGTQVIPQHPAQRQDGKKTFHYLSEIIIRRIQDKIARMVVAGNAGSKAAADAAPIYDDMIFGVLLYKRLIHELHIAQHFPFAALAGAFPEAAIIHQHHVVVIPVKILGILCPSFDAAGIAMEIKDKAGRCFAVKMQPVDAHPGLYIKEVFAKRNIIPELEIPFQLLWLEDEALLQEICCYGKQGNAADNIPDKNRQEGTVDWIKNKGKRADFEMCKCVNVEM